MGTMSPAVADAFTLLQADLYGHLDEAEFLATKYAEWSEQDMAVARGLIPALVLLTRGLLDNHEVQPSGDCRICVSPWPCREVTLIHAFLKDPKGQFVELVRRANSSDGFEAVDIGYGPRGGIGSVEVGGESGAA